MGVMRAEPAAVTDWAARPIGAAWRAFDLQLAAYAGTARDPRPVMAYTNSVEQGQTVADRRHDLRSRPDVDRDRAHRLRRRDRVRLPVAEDVRLAAVPPPHRPADRDPGDRPRRRWLVALDLDRTFDFQFSEIAKILMIVVLANYLGAAPGPARLAAVDPRRLPARRPAVHPRHAPARPRHLAGPIAILVGMLFMSGASLRWLVALAGLVLPRSR